MGSSHSGSVLADTAFSTTSLNSLFGFDFCCSCVGSSIALSNDYPNHSHGSSDKQAFLKLSSFVVGNIYGKDVSKRGMRNRSCKEIGELKIETTGQKNRRISRGMCRRHCLPPLSVLAGPSLAH